MTASIRSNCGSSVICSTTTRDGWAEQARPFSAGTTQRLAELNGKSPITESNALAIQKAVEMAEKPVAVQQEPQREGVLVPCLLLLADSTTS